MFSETASKYKLPLISHIEISDARNNPNLILYYFLKLTIAFFFPTIFNFHSSPNPRPGSAVKQAVSRRSTHSAVPPSSFQMLPLKVMNCQVVRKASYLNYREGRQRKQHTKARGPFSSSFLHTPVEQNCEFPGKSLM